MGLNWLIKMYESNINCILGDDMGLGSKIFFIKNFNHLFFNFFLINNF